MTVIDGLPFPSLYLYNCHSSFNLCQLMSQSNQKPQQLEQSEQSRPAFLSRGRFPRPALNQWTSQSIFCGDLPVARGRLQKCLGAAMTSPTLPQV